MEGSFMSMDAFQDEEEPMENSVMSVREEEKEARLIKDEKKEEEEEVNLSAFG
jgi:hypothetical protein